jgi:predicted nucleic acid-binding protein
VAVATHLADTSAILRLRHPLVADRLGPLIARGLVATCSMVDLELLFSARNAGEHAGIRARRTGYERLDTEQADWDRAIDVQAALARSGQLRAVGIPALLLAAVAERHRVTLLHYDRDFDLIAATTGQPAAWVCPPGSVP